MLPYQMSRNCEKPVYAQNITNASIRLPRSRKWDGLRMPAIALVFASCVSRNVTYAYADSPQLTTNVMPYIDEYHFGSSDIIQSIAVNVSVSTIIGRPSAAHLRRASSVSGARSS